VARRVSAAVAECGGNWVVLPEMDWVVLLEVDRVAGGADSHQVRAVQTAKKTGQAGVSSFAAAAAVVSAMNATCQMMESRLACRFPHSRMRDFTCQTVPA